MGGCRRFGTMRQPSEGQGIDSFHFAQSRASLKQFHRASTRAYDSGGRAAMPCRGSGRFRDPSRGVISPLAFPPLLSAPYPGGDSSRPEHGPMTWTEGPPRRVVGPASHGFTSSQAPPTAHFPPYCRVVSGTPKGRGGCLPFHTCRNGMVWPFFAQKMAGMPVESSPLTVPRNT